MCEWLIDLLINFWWLFFLVGGSFSDAEEIRILNHYFRSNVSAWPPTTFHIALGTAGSDGSFTEISGNAYARVAVTRATGNWDAAAAGATQNTSAITFPTPTPAGWGTVTHMAAYDAATAGNFLFWTQLATARTVGVGDIVRFDAGTLDISLD